MMIEGLFEHIDYWSWWGLGLFLLIADSLVRGTFLLWMAVAAGLVGLLLLAMPSISWVYQLSGFAVLSIIGFVFWRYFHGKVVVKMNQPTPPPWQ